MDEDVTTSRRHVLGGAAVALTVAGLATACGGSKKKDASPGDDNNTSETPSETPSSPAAATTGAASGNKLGATSEIPVGSGKIFTDQKVVVTQPAAGQFKGFSAVCTHMGCTVAEISGGEIHCPCHGSAYSITDGSVKNGPASRPLPAKQVTVQGDSVMLA
ncbi:MAG: Rieske (2Fe-2S) protein [Mycobacteriales bacterium]|jgi:Rieske Fe-S protein